MTVAVLWGLAACVLAPEQRLDQRIIEMRDHEIDAFDALDAYARGELDELKAAGGRLAREDDVPGLPPAAGPMLKTMRSVGTSLSKISGVEEAPPHLSTLAGSCGSCHETLEVSPVAPDRARDFEQAFFAVALRDEERWGKIAEALTPHGGPSAGTWAERQAVLTKALAAAAAAN